MPIVALDAPEFMKYLRKKTGYNIPALAHLLGVHKTTLYSWQKGSLSHMPFQTLQERKDKMREEFGIDIRRVTNEYVEVALPEGDELLKEGKITSRVLKDVEPSYLPYGSKENKVTELVEIVIKQTKEILLLTDEVRDLRAALKKLRGHKEHDGEPYEEEKGSLH